MGSKRYIYWDSNCFISYLCGDEPGSLACRGVVDIVEQGKAEIVTSAFTMVEVVKYKVRGENSTHVKELGRERRQELESCFSPENHVRIVNVDIFTANMAREAVWDHGIQPKDAIHVGSAMQFKRTGMRDTDELVFQTFDKSLISHANGIDGIRFEEPSTENYPYQLTAEDCLRQMKVDS